MSDSMSAERAAEERRSRLLSVAEALNLTARSNWQDVLDAVRGEFDAWKREEIEKLRVSLAAELDLSPDASWETVLKVQSERKRYNEKRALGFSDKDIANPKKRRAISKALMKRDRILRARELGFPEKEAPYVTWEEIHATDDMLTAAREANPVRPTYLEVSDRDRAERLGLPPDTDFILHHEVESLAREELRLRPEKRF